MLVLHIHICMAEISVSGGDCIVRTTYVIGLLVVQNRFVPHFSMSSLLWLIFALTRQFNLSHYSS